MQLKELEYLCNKIPDYKITEHLSIKHPTYKEIVEYGETKYIELLYNLCTTPHDYKSELYDIGTDWDKVDDLEWFKILFSESANIIFTEDIRHYQLYIDNKTNKYVIYNPYLDEYLTENHIELIREHINSMIGNSYKEHREIPANEITRKLLIENDRFEKERSRRKCTKCANSVSIKDIITNILINKYLDKDEEIINKKIGYDFHYKDLQLASESGFRSGQLDVIKQLADEIYLELQEGL